MVIISKSSHNLDLLIDWERHKDCSRRTVLDTGTFHPLQSGLAPVQSGLIPMQNGLTPMQSGLIPMQSGLAPNLLASSNEKQAIKRLVSNNVYCAK